ncbi:Up in starvation [Zalaria obscura]|uniref:Up in starvation n=1 Tax=Zalaria obscura TaxID=2024903 RepID=A0ACC3SD84_9PEZI
MTSQGGHSRGHSRNLSASSVTSTGSSVAGAEDSRRRPQPLAMAQDGSARARLTLDTFNPAIGSPGTQYGYYNPQSPSGHSTPTSATFSTDTGSPRFSSGVQSPSALSRSSYYNGSRTPGRRLSVPSGAHPSQMHQGGPIYPPPPAVFFSPMASSTASNFSPGSSVFANPTSSVFSQGRRDSDADLEYRRRTWHPGTYAGYVARPATSGLTYHSTPDDTRPALAAQPAASQVTRLPGIESFDHAPPPPAPQRQLSSPMQVESRQPVYSGPMDSSAPGPDDRRAHPGWEAGLHQNLTKLEIANATPPKEGQNWIEHARLQHGSSHQRSISASSSSYPQQQMYVVAPNSTPSVAMDPSRADQPRQNKRKAWYGGPVGAPQPPTGSQPIMIAQPRTSPEDSGSSDGVPTPSTSQGHELHPAILHANGMIEMQPPGTTLTEEQQKTVQAYAKPTPTRADSGFQSYVSGSTPGLSQGHIPVMQAGRDIHLQPFSQPPPARPANDMGRLEALVAVATSENRAVEHRT